ncbi:hypothetical protein CYY_008811 [Polysphondylium violaceum]|uniref:WD40 repeat-containing protein n=1 Tax=Polysphondylium violaceum TaxID=133409 RepID=A0A8J4UPX5_9MYCE|nr:hypothetical protein CYY_008811 [Polysphondylium violaceum]
MSNDNDQDVLCNYVSQRLTSSPYDLKWIPSSPCILTVGKKTVGGVVKGDLKIHKFEYIDDKPKLSLEYEGNSISPLRCCSFMRSSTTINNNERIFVTGDFSGSLLIWDSDKINEPMASNSNTHQGTISSIDTHLESNIIVTGGKDSLVCLWDKRDIKSPIYKYTCQTKENSNCWAISTNGKEIICGYENGQLNIFDIKTNSLKANTRLKGGISSIDISSINNVQDIGNEFLVSTSQSLICKMKLQQDKLSIVKEITTDSEMVWSSKYFNNHPSIYTLMQGDGNAYIYKNDQLLKKLSISKNSPIISFDHNPEKLGLMSCITLNKQLFVLLSPLTS